MQDLLLNAGIIFLVCSPTAALVAFGIYTGAYTRVNERPKYPDKRELDRREYETMLRHRQRAKLKKQFSAWHK